jgi:predicted RNase H-related nuclease YkuK (DUF458 family)
MEYKKLDNTVIKDIAEYLKTLLTVMPQSKIYIGTDSQNKDNNTIFVTAIVIHVNSNNGGHVLYTKDKLPRIKDKFQRLWDEVQRSVDIANYLKLECGIDIESIDLDLNSNAKWDSSKILKPAVGYVESLGYKVRYKPGATYATRIADVLCR